MKPIGRRDFIKAAIGLVVLFSLKPSHLLELGNNNSDSEGGYLVPEEFKADLCRMVRDARFAGRTKV